MRIIRLDHSYIHIYKKKCGINDCLKKKDPKYIFQVRITKGEKQKLAECSKVQKPAPVAIA